MDFRDIHDVVSERAGISIAPLAFLYPDSDLLKIMAFQPGLTLSITATRVGPHNQLLSNLQFTKFIELARAESANIAISPEYSCPWSAIEETVRSGFHAPECVLVLGCESISVESLAALRERTKDKVEWFWDPEISNVQGDFVDPACWLLPGKRQRAGVSEDVVIAVVQFKTEYMGGTPYEREHLKKGSYIYRLRRAGAASSINISTLICSDVLSDPTEEFLSEIGTNGLILHLQLNKAPRNGNFRRVRERLFAKKRNVEVLCLNWAANVPVDGEAPWGDAPCSCHYVHYSSPKGQEFDLRPERFNSNHSLGLHLVYSRPCYTFNSYLNFNPGIYCWRSTKPSQENAAGAHPGRTGPEAKGYWHWDASQSKWNSATLRGKDGLEAALAELPPSAWNVIRGFPDDPHAIERFISLSCGHATTKDWLTNLVGIPLNNVEEDETIRRISFAQDPNGRESRIKALSLVFRLNEIITSEDFPACIRTMKTDNGRLQYFPERPCLNLYSDAAESASVAYLGEQFVSSDVEHYYRDMADLLRSLKLDHRRLVVWYAASDGSLRNMAEEKPADFTDPDTDHGSSVNQPK